MKLRYRIKQKGDKYYPQVRRFGIWWGFLFFKTPDSAESYGQAKVYITLHHKNRLAPTKYYEIEP